MAQLYRLDSADPRTGGVLAKFPSGKSKQIQWTAGEPIEPVNEAAKRYSALVLQQLLDEGATDDAERTNWASFAAAVSAILRAFNERLPHAAAVKP